MATAVSNKSLAGDDDRPINVDFPSACDVVDMQNARRMHNAGIIVSVRDRATRDASPRSAMEISRFAYYRSSRAGDLFINVENGPHWIYTPLHMLIIKSRRKQRAATLTGARTNFVEIRIVRRVVSFIGEMSSRKLNRRCRSARETRRNKER